MGNHLVDSLVSIAAMVAGVAIIATIVSKNANTSQVITSAASGYSSVLGTALSPVTGSGSLGLSNNNLTVQNSLTGL